MGRSKKSTFGRLTSSKSTLRVDKDESSPLNLKPRTSSGSRSGSKDDGEFGQTVREIRELVAPHLDSLQRKQIDDVTKKAMGARKEKNQRMPMYELRNRLAAAKRGREQREEEEKHSGVKTLISDRYQKRAIDRNKTNQRKGRRENRDAAKMSCVRRAKRG